MNVFTFTGNLGSDAETRYTQGGKAVTNFSVPVTSGWGDNKTTTWIRCNLWGDRGEKLAKYLTKGKMVAVSGEFSAREWEKDGVTKTSCEVNVREVTLCGGHDASQRSAEPQQAAQPAQGGGDDFGDTEIPF